MSPLPCPTTEFRIREERLLLAEAEQSLEILEELLAPDFREFGSSGHAVSRTEILRARRDDVPAELGVDCFSAQVLSEEVVLTTYQAIARKAGAPKPSRSLRSSLWRRGKDGSWQVVFHQGTRTPAL